MKKINDKVFQDIFDAIVQHCEFMKTVCHHDMSYGDFNRYLIGARYALNIAFNHDYDTCTRLDDFFDHKRDEYFGGKDCE